MLEEISKKIDIEIEKILKIKNLSNEQLHTLINYKEYLEDKNEREESRNQSKAWIETMSKLPM